MGKGTGRRESREVGRRDWRMSALWEIFLVSLAAAGVLALIVMTRNAFEIGPERGPIDLIAGLGEAAASHLTAALGVVATVQLACLIAIVTGQIVHRDSVEESKLRGTLSLISISSVMVVAPAVTAVTLHEVRSFEGLGLLLVVIPIYALQLGISIVIGTFEVGDEETLRRFAEERVDRAKSQIAQLKGRPLRTLGWAVRFPVGVIVGIVVITAVAGAVIWGANSLPSAGDALLAVAVLSVGIFEWTAALVVVNSTLKLSSRGMDVISVVILLAITPPFYLLCTLLVVATYWPLGVAMACTGVVLVAQTVVSIIDARRVKKGAEVTRKASRFFGMIGLVGTGEALALAEKENARARKQVDKYAKIIAKRDAERAAADGERRGPAEKQPATVPQRSRLRRALVELVG